MMHSVLFSRCLIVFTVIGLFVYGYGVVAAKNLTYKRDTISSSVPSAYANHTLEFGINTAILPGGTLELDFPADFTIIPVSSTTFGVRNVELLVNGVSRSAAAVADAANDGVTITAGAGGSISYTLNSTTGIAAGSALEWRIGNQTSGSLGTRTVIVGTSSTTTLPADREPIQNSATLGNHMVSLNVTGAEADLGGDFLITLIEQVSVGPVDTTEEIPPFRFNGAPTSTTSGTTPNVEISLETDEFAQCRYATTASTSYATMPQNFNSSGLIIHTRVVAVMPNTTYTFYVRCSDDEGNVNIDDYIISFTVPPAPTGEPNEDGDNEGDGSGPNDSGSGGGDGTGNGTGGNNGNQGGSQSSGSGGGGSGGGGGGGSSSGSGGGFENDGPYESGDGRVNIVGSAWPRADIVVLVDGQEAETTRADSDGEFRVTIDEIARGAYTFGVYAEDTNGVKSSTFSTSFTVSGARASTLSNINITGTVEVNPDPVPLNGTAVVRGYTLPNASVTLENRPQGGGVTTLFATSDGSGFYSTTLAAAGLSQGTYEIRVQAEQTGGASTEFSNWNFYGIGEEADVPINADLNRDGRVNLTDFSILLFWWNTNGGDSDPPADINQDGNVSLTDFSILLFNWTG